jgi:glycosyltransferase involved in cell wall biosynthesis
VTPSILDIARASSSGYRSPPPKEPSRPNAVGATWRTRILAVSLITLGSPDQLTGGYLYHRRIADAAPTHDARVTFHSARLLRNPFDAYADVILVDSIAAAVTAAWLWRRPRRRPLAAILHQPPGGIDHGPVRRGVQARLDAALYRRCRLLIAASEALAAELADGHGLPRDRIVVIPPGRDVAPIPTATRDLRIGRDAAFLTVGNWVERKGILELLEAFSGLDADLATLHLVGRTDIEPRYAERVRARLSAADLADRVVVHGPVTRDEVAAMYASADAFVLPSRREPYGTVYGEAMAAGLPVAGWSAGNLPNLAEDGVHGVVVEPGDLGALANGLRRLAGDEQWRGQLAQAARRRAEDFPTWSHSAAELFAALKHLVQRSG